MIYDIEWRLVGGSTTLITGITTTYYDLTGLTEESSYEWRVRADDNGTKGAWSGWQTFNTLAESTGTFTYDVEWRAVGGGSTIVTNISDTFYDLTGLSSGTSYEWRVQSDDNGTKSGWSGWQSFSTTSSQIVVTGGVIPLWGRGRLSA